MTPSADEYFPAPSSSPAPAGEPSARDARGTTLMRGRVCLVTGASSGIGRATAIGLALLGASVVLLCRDARRGERACEEVQRESEGAGVSLVLVDLASFASFAPRSGRSRAGSR